MCHYKGVANDQSLHDNMGMARCALNPETMQSGKYKIVPTKNPKKVAIIGGGIGGMEVARVLKLRGHEPVIFEKSDKLGGVFNAASAPSFKEKDRELLLWYAKQIADLNIEVNFNTEITDKARLDGFDKIVVATGGAANKPRIEGIDKAIEACDYLYGKEVGYRVVIIGGGLTGCEIAYDLFRKGHEPVIVEMKNDLIAVTGVCLANSSYLRDFFALNKVETHLETKLVSVSDGFVTVMDKDGKKFDIKADTVIRSMGYHPTPALEKSSGVYFVGDCKKVGNLRTVVWGAWDVAMKI